MRAEGDLVEGIRLLLKDELSSHSSQGTLNIFIHTSIDSMDLE